MVTIDPFLSVAGDRLRLAEIDDIFYSSSATQSFQSEALKRAFRERWLGRYFLHFPELALVAREGDTVVGYIVGAHEDPATDPRFADIAYFRDLAPLTATLPAHLHINLAAGARNQGTGGRLIEAFCERAAAAAVGGVHVVTAAASRNRPFYARHGFELCATLAGPGGDIVMLGRRLAAASAGASA